jgi:hypothetical protein
VDGHIYFSEDDFGCNLRERGIVRLGCEKFCIAFFEFSMDKGVFSCAIWGHLVLVRRTT